MKRAEGAEELQGQREKNKLDSCPQFRIRLMTKVFRMSTIFLEKNQSQA
jgi:hypothetical protein